ncbi:MAG: hypothetical protein K6G10_06815 [Butyrivibrio sp.]|nr:hypothetical protein [Butyrivibrio sp.]
MFGFGKKKHTSGQVNNTYDPVLYNLDGQPVINRDTGEFLMDFDEGQKKILRQLLDNRMPIGSFAYKGLPASYMNNIAITIAPYKNPDGGYSFTWYNEEILYKIVHTDLTLDQFNDCLTCMMHGIDVCEKIENISSYSHEILSLVAAAAREDVDVTDKVTPNLDIFAFSKDVQKILDNAKKKRQKDDREFKNFYRFFRA